MYYKRVFEGTDVNLFVFSCGGGALGCATNTLPYALTGMQTDNAVMARGVLPLHYQDHMDIGMLGIMGQGRDNNLSLFRKILMAFIGAQRCT